MLQSSSSPFLSRQHWVRRMWTPIKMGMMKKLIKDGKGAPWRLAGGRSLKQQFSHDETGWYADIPLWPGPRGACAMVCGADTLLDMLAGENARITLRLSLEPQHLRGGNAVSGVLDYVRPDGLGDGADYRCSLEDEPEFELWLCGVTEFVFGFMPKRIYFEVA